MCFRTQNCTCKPLQSEGSDITDIIQVTTAGSQRWHRDPSRGAPQKRRDKLPGPAAHIRRSGTMFCSTIVSEAATSQRLPRRSTLRRFRGVTRGLRAFVLSQVPKSEGAGAPGFLCGEMGHLSTGGA